MSSTTTCYIALNSNGEACFYGMNRDEAAKHSAPGIVHGGIAQSNVREFDLLDRMSVAYLLYDTCHLQDGQEVLAKLTEDEFDTIRECPPEHWEENNPGLLEKATGLVFTHYNIPKCRLDLF